MKLILILLSSAISGVGLAKTHGYPNRSLYQVFADHCLECHSGPDVEVDFASVPFRYPGLDDQTEILDAVVQAISHDSYSRASMPPKPRKALAMEDRLLIQLWAEGKPVDLVPADVLQKAKDEAAEQVRVREEKKQALLAKPVECRPEKNQWVLVRKSDGSKLTKFGYSKASCQNLLEIATDTLTCAYYDETQPIAANGHPSTGWRPVNIATGKGLGRYAFVSFPQCAQVVAASRGEIVCTNTGAYERTGWKVTNINNNLWCGSSVSLDYCVKASVKSQANETCSYPADGLGKENRWRMTRIGDTCEDLTPEGPLADCQP